MTEPLHRVTPLPDRGEIENVDAALRELAKLGMLPDGAVVDHAKFDALRTAVKGCFEVPWTSITAPMERLLYGISATHRPRHLFALGVFCGNTLIWNVGAACGPGRCYDADRLVGVEIESDSVAIARRNLEALGVSADVDLRCEDAHATVRDLPGPIDLLYLDANGYSDKGPSRGKRIYLTMLEAALPLLSPGALVIAHDHLISCFDEGQPAHDYLAFVRKCEEFRTSVSVEIDQMGIEVTQRA